MKPIVHYRGEATPWGTSAILMALDHPNHLPGHDIHYEVVVTTSSVISWDKTTGCIETKNTIYLPEVSA